MSAAEVRDSYSESLSKLTFNSRPVIMNLTELANEYRHEYALVIVQCIEERMKRTSGDQKLPCLYLMDSIVKNHPVPYKDLFQQNLVNNFAHIFSVSEVSVRVSLHKLRQTWNDVFSPVKLHQLDLKTKEFDPKWPVAKLVAPPAANSGTIHINPAVFNRAAAVPTQLDPEARLQEAVRQKELELLELKKRKIELEVEKERKDMERLQNLTKSSESSTNFESASQSSSKAASSSTVAVPTSSSQQKTKHNLLSEAKAQSASKTSSSSSRDKPAASRASPHKSSSSSSNSSERKSSSARDPRKRSDAQKRQSPAPLLPKKSATPPPTRREGSQPPPAPPASAKEHQQKRSSSAPREEKPSSKKRSSEERSHHHREIVASHRPSPPPAIPEEPPVKKSKKTYRIPKKPGGNSAGEKRSPTPNSFQEEGPHMEFNKGKWAKSKKKQQGGQQDNKRVKLNNDLFGDDEPKVAKHQNSVVPPQQSWSKIKEANPDSYRTPFRDDQRSSLDQQDIFGQGPTDTPVRRNQRGQQNQRGGRNNRRGGDGGMNAQQQNRFPNGGPVFGGPCLGGNVDNSSLDRGGNGNNDIGRILNHMENSNTDPHVVETQVIPQIIRQAQDSFQQGSMNPEEFSNLMRQVMILKEQAMMVRAERRDPAPGPQGPEMMAPPLKGMGGGGPMPFVQGPPGGPLMPPPQGPVIMPGMNPHNNRDLPLADSEDLELIAHDPAKSIPIDSMQREIRFYEETATCVMGVDDIRELSFQGGETRRVIVDGDPSIIPPLRLDTKEYTDFMLDGVTHKIKIGAPTRELWIDGQWHECYFNTEIRIRVGQRFRSLFLEGPPPVVKHDVSRRDLCAGYIQMIVNGELQDQHRLYLDSKPQKIVIDGKPHVLKFVQALTILSINGHPFRTEFGGLPMIFYVNGNKHYLRLTSLPKGVERGHVRLWGMDGARDNSGMGSNINGNKAKRGRKKRQKKGSPSSASPPGNSQMHHHQHPHALDMGNNFDHEEGSSNMKNRFDSESESAALDNLLTLFPSSQNREADACSEASSYSCKDDQQQQQNESSSNNTTPSPAVTTSPAVNVKTLFDQLLLAGLVGGGDSAKSGNGSIPGLETPKAISKETSKAEEEDASKNKKDGDEEKENKETNAVKREEALEEKKVKSEIPEIKDINLASRDLASILKIRQQGIVNMMYNPSALQCKNCGVRYSSSDMMAYSQHLDWHFRMKRREKDNAKKAKSREWYYPRMDWIVSEEIEDEEKDLETEVKTSADAQIDIPTVQILNDSDTGTCPICREEFEQFFKQDSVDTPKVGAPPTEDDEGWHYRNAVRMEGIVYHPQCHQDQKKHLDRLDSSVMSEATETEDESEAEQTQIKSEVTEETSEVKMEVAEREDDQPNDVVMEDASEAEKLDPEAIVKEDGSSDSIVKAELKSPLAEGTEDAEGTNNSTEDKDIATQVKTEAKEEEEAGVEVKKEVKDVENGETVVSPDDSSAEGTGEAGNDKDTPPPEADEINDSINEHNLIDPKVTNQMAPPTQSQIKFNITTKIELERRESVISNSQSDSEESEFDRDGVIHESKLTEEERNNLKPKMAGKKFVVVPPRNTDSDVSGLCSIM